MSVNLTNRDPSLHLRDAQHAHQLFTDNFHAFAPKTKFLYHVQFVLRTASRKFAPNTASYLKEIGVLAKSVDLPTYRASVETKQQYNRKKNVQTRIDYNDIRMIFHDDNTGLTKKMLEEYYRYYFKDGSKNDGTGKPVNYSPRDKFSPSIYSYGMDVDPSKSEPFFDYIKIFQLSRQQWFSYTLINPIITQWGHDTLDSSDGSGIMENNINLLYEGVLYNQGEIIEGADPAGFTDAETRYDNTPSPLIGGSSFDPNLSPKSQQPPIRPESELIYERNQSQDQGLISRLINSAVQNSVGGVNQIEFPKTNTQG